MPVRPAAIERALEGETPAVAAFKAAAAETAKIGAVADAYVLGEIVVASSRGGGGKFRLYSIERTNLSQLRPLSADTGQQIDPAFSPDGSRIVFVSNRDGNPEIYAMDADGSNVARLTNDPQLDGHPVFTPDGQAILFQSQRAGGKLQIFSMNADGTGVKQLTQDSVSMAPAELFAAKQKFEEVCTSCHGPVGEGAANGVPLFDAHDAAKNAEVIAGGRGQMPAFADTLGPDAIGTLAFYVSTLKPAK